MFETLKIPKYNGKKIPRVVELPKDFETLNSIPTPDTLQKKLYITI